MLNIYYQPMILPKKEMTPKSCKIEEIFLILPFLVGETRVFIQCRCGKIVEKTQMRQNQWTIGIISVIFSLFLPDFCCSVTFFIDKNNVLHRVNKEIASQVVIWQFVHISTSTVYFFYPFFYRALEFLRNDISFVYRTII